jgi:hypothetical protein
MEYNKSLLAVLDSGIAITPHDTNNIVPPSGDASRPTRGLFVGGAGTVTMVMADGSVVQITAIAGQYLPVAIKRVNATGTAATLLVAFY